ncbi:MAG: hypothetical protein QW057_06710 [Candidatus Bathyarchaeia archaeon]
MKRRSIVKCLAKRSRLALLVVAASVFLIPSLAEAQGGTASLSPSKDPTVSSSTGKPELGEES